MTNLEQKVAAAICEKLFGPFSEKEIESPSSVSAQSLMAARAALDITAQTLEDRAGNVVYRKAWRVAARLLRSANAEEVNRIISEVN